MSPELGAWSVKRDAIHAFPQPPDLLPDTPTRSTTQPEAASTPEPHPWRVLIVDDEPIILEALREMLALEGYEVITHTDPTKALEELRRVQFATILSDQKMPELTGLEFLAHAKRLQPDATRILFTGVLSLDTVIDAINNGEIYRFIVKPWLREELLVTLRNAIQRYELITANASLQARTLAMNQELQAQLSQIAQQNQELARLNQALGENLQRSLELCIHTLGTYFPPLGAQARRVHHLCRAMADVVQLPPEQKQALEVSAWLCDIGLIGVPRTLIKRWYAHPASLADAEKRTLQHHPISGQELAKFVQPLADVGSIIRAHHERFDGRGFPDHLEGEEIPWLARLLSVAVGFAESNEEPTEAAQAIRSEAGVVYDPEAVRIFWRALQSSSVPRKQLEVLLSELRPGMLLASGIYTSNGVLLVSEGQRLTQASIDKVLNHNKVAPINQALLVYC